MQLAEILEAILFAAEKPLSLKELKEVFADAAEGDLATEESRALKKVKESELQAALDTLQARYQQEGSSLQIREVADAIQLVTKPEYTPWLRKLFAEHRPPRLSQPSLETLAIIAYRQPITRAEVEAIRGVAIDGVVQTLLERGLIKITGRSEVPGKPLLYGTTPQFLEHFGLKNLDQLPAVQELRRVNLNLSPPSPTTTTTPQKELELDDGNGAGPGSAVEEREPPHGENLAPADSPQ